MGNAACAAGSVKVGLEARASGAMQALSGAIVMAGGVVWVLSPPGDKGKPGGGKRSGKEE